MLAHRPRFAAAATLALASGCGGHPVNFPGPPELTLGYGISSFTAVADGASVPIIMGLQGGYHIWGAALARYLDPVQIHLVFTLRLPGDPQPFTIRHDNIDLDAADGGFSVGHHLGSAVFLPDVTAARGHACLWRLDATDRAGRSVSVEKSIVPVGP